MELPGPIAKAAEDLKARQAQRNEPPTPETNPEPEQAPVPKQNGDHSVDWEKRFKGYKTATDSTIRDLRDKFAEQEASIARLQIGNEQLTGQLDQAKNAKPQQLIPDGVLSPDDLEILGADNAERIAKLADAAAAQKINVLTNTIQALEKRLAVSENAEIKRSVTQTNADFWNAVREQIPEVNEIDADPDFRAHLSEIDPQSGKTWKELGIAARQAGDVGRMVEFYADWKKAHARPSREGEAVPTGTNTPPPTPQQGSTKIWKKGEYQASVHKLTTGGPITPEKQKKIDALYGQYLDALREGRVQG